MGDREQVEGANLERTCLIHPGEFKKVLNEGAHANGFLLDALHSLTNFFRSLECTHPVKLGIAANRDQGSAQLMAGVTDEALHLIDRASTVSKGAVDPAQHDVERAVQAPHLCVGG